ncbi:MAG TPA: tetratricopeptide repeat protein [Steroidobacteraceae bacterium]|nr:tetratricopeptide repeat protein [Steroidobacteraceae bacterium]
MTCTKIIKIFGIMIVSVAFTAHADPVQIQILSAVVKDQHIADATVILQKNGAQSVSGTTDVQGNVTLNSDIADTSDTLVIVKKSGYSNLVAKCPCKSMTYAISPVMTNLDGMRIVLNWGATPRDIDSHLAFSNEHIYFGHKTGSSGTDANLDVDDTDSYGPETITIEKKHAGESYVYAVHDYSDASVPHTTNLSQSHAKVLVYVGQSLVRSYYVPEHAEGNLWTVFRITGEGDFQDINTMSGTTKDASEVLGNFNNYLNAHTQVAEHVASAANISNAKSSNKQGEDAYHAGNLDRAIELFQQAVELDGNYGQAYSNLGLAYQKAGRTAEAIWANRKAIALATGPTANTVRASSYYNIAKIYEAAGQYQDALTQYESAKREKQNPVYDKAIERVKALIK